MRRYRILRPTDDPNDVLVELEFDGLPAAESFRTAPRTLRSRAEGDGLIEGPSVRIVDEVESREY